MNKTITLLLVALLIPSAMAIRVGNIDQECQRYDFDFGIAKWEYSDNGFFLAENTTGYNTSVTGDDSHAYWSSSPAAAGILSKEGQDYQILSGGMSGETFQGDHGISHITLCGDDDFEEVPEFGVIASLFVLAVAGFFVIRKRG